MTDYKTPYSSDKNINTLDRGSYNDFGDGTPAKQVLVKQASGEIFKVNVVSSTGDSKAIYNEVAAVAVSSETLLTTYTVPTGQGFSLARVLVGGENRAKFLIKVNGTIIGVTRTWWTEFNKDVPFDNLTLNGDDILSVHVINRGISAETFEATILGDEF